MALAVFKDRTALKDSIFTQQTKVQLAQLEGKRELDIKERELQIARLKESNRQKERIGYISGILLLLLVMAIFARKFFRQVRTNKMLAHQKRMHLEHIETQKSILMDIAHIQSHEIRGPIATILGLMQLFNYDDVSDPNKELIAGVHTTILKLDEEVKNIVRKTAGQSR